MRDDADVFERAGAGVVLVGLGRPEQASAFCDRRDVPFPCVVQPDRSAHKAFGLRRGTWNETVGPAVWMPWLKNQVTGKAQGKFGQGDVAQLPGTFVVDPSGTVRYAHRGRNSGDVAPNDEVLAAVATLREGA